MTSTILWRKKLVKRRSFKKCLAILIFLQAATASLYAETYTDPIENVDTLLASKALELFRIHSDDDIEAKITYALALIFWDRGAEAQHSAFALIEDVARSDVPEAQYILGDLLSDGIGVKENYRKAAESYEKAALSGYTPAQMALAEVFEAGYGVPEDLVSAYAWFNIASGYGLERAQIGKERVSLLLSAPQLQEAQALARSLHREITN